MTGERIFFAVPVNALKTFDSNNFSLLVLLSVSSSCPAFNAVSLSNSCCFNNVSLIEPTLVAIDATIDCKLSLLSAEGDRLASFSPVVIFFALIIRFNSVIFLELLLTFSSKPLPAAKDAPINLDGFIPLLVVDAAGSASGISVLLSLF